MHDTLKDKIILLKPLSIAFKKEDFNNETSLIDSFIVNLSKYNKEDFASGASFDSKVKSFNNDVTSIYKKISYIDEIPVKDYSKYQELLKIIAKNKAEEKQRKIIVKITDLKIRIDRAENIFTLNLIKKDYDELYDDLNDENKKNHKVISIQKAIEVKEYKIKNATYLRNKKSFIIGSLSIFFICIALLFGITMYDRFIALKAANWCMFEVPYFGSGWNNWGVFLWNHWDSLADATLDEYLIKLLLFFIYALLYIIIALIEIVVIILSNIVFAICWLLLFLYGGALYLLYYSLRGLFAFMIIIGLFTYTNDHALKGRFKYIFTSSLTLITIGLSVFSYLYIFMM